MATLRATLLGHFAAVALLTATSDAQADRFYGPHPVVDSFSGRVVAGTWCNDTTYHIHNYAADPSAFVLEGDSYLFLANPQDYGYTGQVYSYSGPHALDSFFRDGWCPQEGVHTHYFQPYASEDWSYQNNIYYYQGPPTVYAGSVFPLVTIVRPSYYPPVYSPYGYGPQVRVGVRPSVTTYHYPPIVTGAGAYPPYGYQAPLAVPGPSPYYGAPRLVPPAPTYVQPGFGRPYVQPGFGSSVVPPPTTVYNQPRPVTNYQSAPGPNIIVPSTGRDSGRVYVPAPAIVGGGFRRR
jgi:hypothetical protein